MKENAEAVIKNIDPKSLIRLRLFELGFIPGTIIRCISINPKLDTVVVRVRGATICLRTAEAAFIKI